MLILLADISQSLQAFWNQGVDPDKVTLGLAYYGHTFTLENGNCNTPGCPATGPGKAGPCSLDAGTLIDSEINNIIANHSINPALDKDNAVKYFAWNKTQW
jgi:chitinase